MGFLMSTSFRRLQPNKAVRFAKTHPFLRQILVILCLSIAFLLRYHQFGSTILVTNGDFDISVLKSSYIAAAITLIILLAIK